jgi:uncharacterized protein YyaL (SSP411 family)
MRLVLAIVLASCGAAPMRTTIETAPAWNEWSAEAFARAEREDRLILLSVQAGWCHWCHVMNDVTYRDGAVRRALDEHFVMIRVEGDARPDLAERYRDYAWPATVFLDPEGDQLLALRGYRSPERFTAILSEVIAAHREGRAVDGATSASETPAEDLVAVRTSLIAQLDRMYAEDAAGWGGPQKYPFAAPVEHAFYRAAVRGEEAWRDRALATLTEHARLIDPVWGGMYQYSEGGVWTRPHYEKIVSIQAGALLTFAEAFRATGDRRWLEHAANIHRYVRDHLTAPDGAFYTSQDADLGEIHGPEYFAHDDAGRRALGIPRVDTHVYAATNGMLIEALATSSIATGVGLDEAIRSAERVIGTHRRSNGLFAHDASDQGLLHLADQAWMLAAFVALHQASGDPRWKEEASALARAMNVLRDGEGGFFAHTEDPDAVGVFRERRVPITDNAIVARALLVLARTTDNDSMRETAIAALRACARPNELRELGRMIGEYLMALETLEQGHVLLSIVGPDDEGTRALHRAALDLYEPRRLIELGRPGASRYPFPGEPAIFLCTADACSMPVFAPQELPGALLDFLGR